MRIQNPNELKALKLVKRFREEYEKLGQQWNQVFDLLGIPEDQSEDTCPRCGRGGYCRDWCYHLVSDVEDGIVTPEEFVEIVWRGLNEEKSLEYDDCECVHALAEAGQLFDSKLWRAISSDPPPKGDYVLIASCTGDRMEVVEFSHHPWATHWRCLPQRPRLQDPSDTQQPQG